MYLLFILFIIAVCIGGMPMMFYYASFRFGWDSYDEGLYMLYMSVTRMFWMLGVGRTLHRIVAGEQVGTSDDQGMVTRKTRVDVNVIRIGMLVLGFGYVGLGFATKAWMLYASKSFDTFIFFNDALILLFFKSHAVHRSRNACETDFTLAVVAFDNDHLARTAFLVY